MHSDADSDTRSPWYEAFAPQTHPPLDDRGVMGSIADTAGSSARSTAIEEDGSTEALFDCYNG